MTSTTDIIGTLTAFTTFTANTATTMAASKLVLIGFHSKKSISFEGLRSECTKNLIFWKIPLLSTLLPLSMEVWILRELHLFTYLS